MLSTVQKVHPVLDVEKNQIGKQKITNLLLWTARALLLPSSRDDMGEVQCRHFNCGSLFYCELIFTGFNWRTAGRLLNDRSVLYGRGKRALSWREGSGRQESGDGVGCGFVPLHLFIFPRYCSTAGVELPTTFLLRSLIPHSNRGCNLTMPQLPCVKAVDETICVYVFK